jgi:hypothetical protein
MSTITDFLNGLGVVVVDDPASFYVLSGATNVYNKDAGFEAFVFGADGKPVEGLYIVNLFPDGNGDVPQVTSGAGRVQYSFGTASAYNPPAKGPYKVLVTDNASKSDPPNPRVSIGAVLSTIVDGIGDVNGTHTFWSLQFTKRSALVPPAGVPVVTAPIEGGLRALSWLRRGVDFNPDAALYKKALALSLGYPLSQEFPFLFNNAKYVAQLFSGGILYCVDGDWGNVQTVSWL